MPVEIGRRVAGHTIITVPIGDLPGVLLERSKFLRAPVESARHWGTSGPQWRGARNPLTLFTRVANQTTSGRCPSYLEPERRDVQGHARGHTGLDSVRGRRHECSGLGWISVEVIAPRNSR